MSSTRNSTQPTANGTTIHATTNAPALARQTHSDENAHSSHGTSNIAHAAVSAMKLADEHFEQANQLFAERKLEAALKEVDSAVILNPRHGDAHCLRGSCLRDLERLPESLTEYKKAAQLKSEYVWVHLSSAYAKLNDPRKALIHFNQTLGNLGRGFVNPFALELGKELRATYKQQTEERFKRAETLFSESKFQDALREVDNALNINPKHARAHCLRGSCLKESGNLQEALNEYKTAIQSSPSFWLFKQPDPSLYNNLEQAYAKLNDPERALSHINEVLSQSPTNQLAVDLRNKFQTMLQKTEEHFRRAEALFFGGKFQDAISEINCAITINPKYANGHCLRGSCLRESGNLQEALSEYKTAIELKPEYCWLYNNLEQAYVKLRDPEKALSHINDVLSNNSNNPSAIELRNKYQAMLKQTEEHFTRAEALFSERKFQDAIRETDRALNISPRHAGAHCLRGSGLREFGNLQEALNEYKTAIQLNPDYPWSYGNLGQAYMKLNDPEKALAHINEILSRNSTNPSAIELRNKLQTMLEQKAVTTTPAITPTAPPQINLTQLYLQGREVERQQEKAANRARFRALAQQQEQARIAEQIARRSDTNPYLLSLSLLEERSRQMTVENSRRVEEHRRRSEQSYTEACQRSDAQARQMTEDSRRRSEENQRRHEQSLRESHERTQRNLHQLQESDKHQQEVKRQIEICLRSTSTSSSTSSASRPNPSVTRNRIARTNSTRSNTAGTPSNTGLYKPRRNSSITVRQLPPHQVSRIGLGGTPCTHSDIMRATNAWNNFNEAYLGIGAQIIDGLSNIKYECAAENIQPMAVPTATQ